MSQENVQLVRRANEAFNRGDYEGYLADVAPEFEYVSSGVIPGAGDVYRGKEQMVAFLTELWDGFENVHGQIHELIEAGDHVVALLTMRARGKQSGAETTWRFFQVVSFRNGEVTRAQGFMHRAEALAAVGLSE